MTRVIVTVLAMKISFSSAQLHFIVRDPYDEDLTSKNGQIVTVHLDESDSVQTIWEKIYTVWGEDPQKAFPEEHLYFDSASQVLEMGQTLGYLKLDSSANDSILRIGEQTPEARTLRGQRLMKLLEELDVREKKVTKKAKNKFQEYKHANGLIDLFSVELQNVAAKYESRQAGHEGLKNELQAVKAKSNECLEQIHNVLSNPTVPGHADEDKGEKKEEQLNKHENDEVTERTVDELHDSQKEIEKLEEGSSSVAHIDNATTSSTTNSNVFFPKSDTDTSNLGDPERVGVSNSGKDLTEQDAKGNTALTAAAGHGHVNVMELLVSHLTEPSWFSFLTSVKVNLLMSLAGNDWNALTAAAGKGQVNVLKCLRSNGFDLNSQDGTGFNAWTAAAGNGQVNVLEYLRSIGVDLNSQDGNGRRFNAWTAAAGNGHVEVLDMTGEVLEVLDMYLPQDGNGTGFNAWTVAALNGHVNVLEYLRSIGVDLNSQDGTGFNALTAAAFKGHVNVLEYLSSIDVDLNSQDGNDLNTLTAAVHIGHVNVLEYLHSKGVDLNSQDGRRFNAWTGAAIFGHVNVLKYLRSNGVDLNSQDGNGWNALTAAARNGHVNVLEYLRSNGVDLNSQDKDPVLTFTDGGGCTRKYGGLQFEMSVSLEGVLEMDGYNASVAAAGNGHVNVLKYLHSKGVDLNSPDTYGRTALTVAAQRSQTQVLEYLASKGIH